MKSEQELADGAGASGFHLTPKHVRAIEAQLELLINDGGYGEVILIVERHRICRITTTTSEKYSDTESGVDEERAETTQSSGSDRSDTASPWQPNRTKHQKTEKRTRSGK